MIVMIKKRKGLILKENKRDNYLKKIYFRDKDLFHPSKINK